MSFLLSASSRTASLVCFAPALLSPYDVFSFALTVAQCTSLFVSVVAFSSCPTDKNRCVSFACLYLSPFRFYFAFFAFCLHANFTCKHRCVVLSVLFVAFWIFDHSFILLCSVLSFELCFFSHFFELYVHGCLQASVENIMKDKMPKKGGRWWFSWRSRNSESKSVSAQIQLLSLSFNT